jgi:hypothetical protein
LSSRQYFLAGILTNSTSIKMNNRKNIQRQGMLICDF